MDSRTSSEANQQDASLTSILSTPAMRTEYILLVMLHADSMCDQVAAAFDASHTASRSRTDQGIVAPEDAPPTYVSATSGRGRYDYDRRAEELEDPKTQQLKKAATAYYKNWRVRVLKRMGEALNARPDDVLRLKQRRLVETGRDDHLESMDYRAVSTPLEKLDDAPRMLLLNSLLLLLLSLEAYQAPSRILLLRVASSLLLSQTALVEQESTVAQGLLAAAETQMEAEEATKRRATANTASRAWKVGLATVAGAALVGVTGGLAAPLLATGLGTVFGGLGLGSTAVAGLLGALSGNAVLVGGLFGAYGGRMTGRAVEQYTKDVDDFKFIPTRSVPKEQHRLRVAIGVSGWLTAETDVVDPWRIFGNELEAFALRWELDALLNLGNSLTTLFKSLAWEYAGVEVLRRTVLGTIAAGLWPLGLLRVARVIDNPFAIARARSDKAGRVLADALINKAQGERPVTLVGYSLGARVIYSCLQALAERKAFGLVETAVLLGAPIPSDAPDWRCIRAVVSGRVVNVFSTNDLILGILYRTNSLQYGVAGLEEVKDVAGVENLDVSELISGHQRYQFMIGALLKRLGIEELDPAAVQEESALLKERDAAEDVVKRKKETKVDGAPDHAENSRWVKVSDIQEDASEISQSQINDRVQKLHLGTDAGSAPRPDALETDNDASDGPINMIDADEIPQTPNIDGNAESKVENSDFHCSHAQRKDKPVQELLHVDPEPFPHDER